MVTAILASFIFTAATAVSSPVAQGERVHVFDTRPLNGGSYLNDHTLVQDDRGAWHVFGIFHKEPKDPDHETQFVHAVATTADPARWQEGSFQLSAQNPIALEYEPKLGETHIWAPHVVKDGKRYVMVFQSGGVDLDQAQIRLAESSDLDHWKRVGTQPLFRDICEARDPMLKKIDGLWVLYYTRCESKKSRLNGVAYRTSVDLKRWSEPKMALVLRNRPAKVNSGYTESPFVFKYKGSYYLSVTSYPVDYKSSYLYKSSSPFSFPDKPIAELNAHAPEWIQTPNQKFYMTHAGWGEGGLYVSQVTMPSVSPTR